MPLNGLVTPIVGFAAFSGTGKTTLLKRLIPELRGRGLRLALVKHAHHSFEVDIPGKDSYELRKAGAEQVLIASRHRWAWMRDLEDEREPLLGELLPHLEVRDCDLILVEGFKHEPIPKIELHRPSLGHPLLFPNDPHVIAVATDMPQAIDTRLPLLALDAPEAIADFIQDRLLKGGLR